MDLIIRIIADGLLVPIVLIGVYLLLFKVPNESKFEVYSRVLMAGLTTYLVAKYMSVLLPGEVERPFQAMGVAAGAAFLPNPGFPSDHALFSTAILYAVWFSTKLRGWSLALLVMVILVCVGRVLALVHTPLDIIGGVVAASFGALWYLTVPTVTTRKVSKSSHK